MKLHKGYCYTLLSKGLGYELKKYKGYYFNIKNIKFDAFKSEMFGWQLNWSGMMIKHYNTLKELKNDTESINKVINAIENEKLKPMSIYFKLMKEVEQCNI